MKTETYVCDIQGCGQQAKHLNQSVEVIFHTDQTEGRSCKAYISFEAIDICENHMHNLEQGYALHATGAQGFNTYYIEVPRDQMRNALAKILKEISDEFKRPEEYKELFTCDHSVGICCCPLIDMFQRADELLKENAKLDENIKN